MNILTALRRESLQHIGRWTSSLLSTKRQFTTSQISRRISSAEIVEKTVSVTFADGKHAKFPMFYLRDHCPCPNCHHPQTKQRLLDTFQLPLDVSAESLSTCEEGNALKVTWSHGSHQSIFQSQWLKERITPTPKSTDSFSRSLWSTQSLGSIPKIPFSEVMTSDKGLLSCLDLLYKYGFAIVTQTPPTADGTAEVAARIGTIRRSFYGDVWSFSANLAHSDLAYTNSYIATHTDGNYFQDSPGLQFFHVIEFEGTGSETLLADGFYAAQQLRAKHPEHFDFLCNYKIPYQYERDDMRLIQNYPAISLDDKQELKQIHFNNEDRATLRFESSKEMDSFYKAWMAFGKIMRSPQVELDIGPLTPGNLLITDNWRVLHGRRLYSGKRTVAGCYLNNEDWMSRWKYLHETLGGI